MLRERAEETMTEALRVLKHINRKRGRTVNPFFFLLNHSSSLFNLYFVGHNPRRRGKPSMKDL